MNLKFTANTLVAAEKSAGKSFVDIIAELDSKSGASLTTIRALLAAGLAGANSNYLVFLDDHGAGKVIDERGIDVVAVEIGKALRTYFGKDTANG
ncbi:hypothetical protein LB521_26805 [Mesorhizobium sp. BR-1-1-8]|uniref:hypothetical protein n=1 Tax=Mesorhizobium sp. BR-1-1-8 TaxID=2876659 RepID=UPI001CCAAF97|nr:hypothetical protein [Mesorhizobium sp. BR-1-1-8]MBZ9984745.1 hypothetical protein [Mesorhizobium sp. BR-1-1-8]